MHFPYMQLPRMIFEIELYKVVRPFKPVSSTSTKSAGADQSQLAVRAMSKPIVKVFRLVLMSVKAEAEISINYILYYVRIHVVDLQRRAFYMVVPHGQP